MIFAPACILGGWLSDRFGRRSTLALFVFLTVAADALARLGDVAGRLDHAGRHEDGEPAAAARPSCSSRSGPRASSTTSSRACTTASARALFMDITTPAVAATQFTAYMALMNLCISYTAWWQGFAVERIGYPADAGRRLAVRPGRAAAAAPDATAERASAAGGTLACRDCLSDGRHHDSLTPQGRGSAAARRAATRSRPRRSPRSPRRSTATIRAPRAGHARCRRSGTGCTSCRWPRRARSAPTATRGAAASCRRCRCRAACGPAAGSSSRSRCASATRSTRTLAHRRRRAASRARSGAAGLRHRARTRSRRAAASRCSEEHDIVYRDAAGAGRGRAAAAGRAARRDRSRATIVPDDVLLFRYSALTFNGHRIHYDRRYVTEVEGYPGLIVHGPLIATLLLDLLRREHARARSSRASSSRRVQPAVRPASASRSAAAPTASGASRSGRADHEGALAMQASADARLTSSTRTSHAEDRARPLPGHPRRRARAVRAVPRRVPPQGRRRSAPIPRRSSMR